MGQSTGYFNNQLGRLFAIGNNTQTVSSKSQQQEQQKAQSFYVSVV
jgi:hypothetical protein